ncbi:MAG: Uma2 family endonuclease, partial [Myxococcota bacterium]
KKRASYQDVLDAPEHNVAEVIAGELFLSPRPPSPHARAASVLGGELGPPFDHGRGGPGGWFTLYEPELHLGDEPAIVVPDLAGWRRSAMPEMPEVAFFTLPPDWVCEVASPSTARLDRVLKLPLYARAGVEYAWVIDPIARSLEVFRAKGAQYVLVQTFADDARARAEPFDAIELELAALWMR